MTQTQQLAPDSNPAQLFKIRDLNNITHDIKTGPGSFIDPDAVIDSPERVRIGANTVIRKGVVLRPESGEILIGNNCVINHYTVMHGKGGIYLGDWTIVAPNCGFYAQNHSYDRFDIPITKQPNFGKGIFLMGDNWLGAGAIVCDDVTIGKGAVIGANSTVTRSIPMAAIAAGSPARIIKMRFGPDWSFNDRERASHQGVPENIFSHVLERGNQLLALLDPADNVLDIGCGEGILTSVFAAKCKTVTATDYSIQAIETAKTKYPNIDFRTANSTSLPFAPASFSKIILSDVAEHLLPLQLFRTLIEAKRVIAPGGTLLIATPLTGKGYNTSTYAHIYEYSSQELATILAKLFINIRLVNTHFGIFSAQKAPGQ